VEVSKEVQEDLANFQNLQRQLQMLTSQKMQTEAQKRETEASLDALRKAKAATDVYKAVGRILIKTDIKDLKKDLGDDSETLDVRLKGIEKQEKKVRDSALELQKKLQSALPQQ